MAKKRYSEFSNEYEFEVAKTEKQIKSADEKIQAIKDAENENEKIREGLFETEHYLNVYFNSKKQRDSFLELLNMSRILEDGFFVNGMSFASALQDAGINGIYRKMNIRGSYVETPKCFAPTLDFDFDLTLTDEEHLEYEKLIGAQL